MCTTMRKLRRGTPAGRAIVLSKRAITVAIRNLKNEMAMSKEGDSSGFVSRIAALIAMRKALTC